MNDKPGAAPCRIPAFFSQKGESGTHIPKKDRYWEIDTARGIAIVMMMFFHIIFDLTFFDIIAWPGSPSYWRLFAAITAALFLFLVGLSFSISAAHASLSMDRWHWYLKYLKRGLGIFTLGIGITIVTWFYLGTGYVVFGILHLIGVSLIILPLFYRYTWLPLATGAGLIFIGIWVQDITGPSYLLWLGVHPDLFYSVDYTPLVPWFGVVLIGLWVGKTLYPAGQKRYFCKTAIPVLARGLMFLGRHSLLIYLVHQPVIVSLIMLLTSG
jgi:uncharacterized membrane protein